MMNKFHGRDNFLVTRIERAGAQCCLEAGNVIEDSLNPVKTHSIVLTIRLLYLSVMSHTFDQGMCVLRVKHEGGHDLE